LYTHTTCFAASPQKEVGSPLNSRCVLTPSPRVLCHLSSAPFCSGEYGEVYCLVIPCVWIHCPTAPLNSIPLSVLIKNGNVHDLSFIDDHVNDLYVLNKKCSLTPICLLADKGYVSNNVKEKLKDSNYNFIYPSKKNMKEDSTFDKKLYNKRIHVEHSFQKLKAFKRVQIRYDSFITSFSSFIFLAVSQIIYRRLNN
jgi:hypothetical protein